MNTNYFKTIEPDNLSTIPQWKLWLLIGASGSASILLMARCLAKPVTEKTPRQIVPAIAGLVTTSVLGFGVYALKREYPRFETTDYVRTRNTQTLILEHLIDDTETALLPPQNQGTGETYGDWADPGDNNTGIGLYNWDDLVDEAVGVIVTGQSGSAKTCTTAWLLGVFTKDEPAHIRVCDPHYNDIWEELGLEAIGEFDEIQAEFEWLIDELDRRRIRKKNKQPLGDNLIVVADEVGACIESFENPEIVQKALKRIGSEGRKFGITLIAIDQSPNSADLGISAKKRDNYLMIGLCSVAIALAKQDLKSNDPIVQFLSAQAYPCVIKMGGIITPAIHPTHGHHLKFKKKGNAPANLMPINQLPAYTAAKSLDTDTDQTQWLDHLYSLDSSQADTQTQGHNQALITCPECGSTDTKGNGFYKGQPRRRCKSCGRSWTVQ